MAVFGPNQREELLIGNALAGETVVSAFIADASNGELGIFSKNGAAAAAGKRFYALQKTNGPSNKGLDYEFSDAINPSMVENVTLKAYEPEVQKLVTVTGFTGTPKANATYEVLVKLYNDGGSLSSENFRVISGFYVTDGNTVTNAEIIDGIVKNLKANQKLEGDSLFTFANVGDTSLTIEALPQYGDPAKNIADRIQFDVQVAVKSNQADPVTALYESYAVLTATVTEAGTSGSGTGKYVSNLEWFTRGYKYDAYRESGYPANFTQPDLYADYNGAYNIIHLNYFAKNSVAGVEEQRRVLTIAVAVNPNTVATNAATNDVLDELRTVLGAGNVPSNLPVA